MKKALFFIAMLIAMVSAVWAGGSADKSGGTSANAGKAGWLGTPDGKTITLRFWAGVQPEYGYDEMVENFNKEYKDRGLQIEYQRYVNNSQGNLQLETYLMGGNDVDVFIGYGGITTLRNRVASNLVYEMSAKLKEYNFDISKELGEVNAAPYIWDDGKIYAFPTKYESPAWMLINVDMFKAAGVKIPYDGWTYDEFLKAIEKLTHGAGQNKVYGVFWANSQWLNGTRGLLGSVLEQYHMYKNDAGTQVNFDDPAHVWRDGLNLLKTAQDKGWAIPYADEVSESMTVANTFMEGKAACSMNISQYRLAMDMENYPHDFKTAIVPGPVPSAKYMTDKYKWHNNRTGAGDLMCIAEKTQYPEQAFEFAMWYIKGGMMTLTKGGRIPIWNGINKQEIIDMIASSAGDAIDADSLMTYLNVDKSSALKGLSFSSDSAINTVFKEELEGVLYGKQSVDTAINNMCIRGNKVIADRK